MQVEPICFNLHLHFWGKKSKTVSRKKYSEDIHSKGSNFPRISSIQRANLFPMYAIPICVSSWWKLFLHCQIQNTVIIIQTQSKEKAQSTSSPLVCFVLNWMFGVKMPFLSCRFCLNIYFYQTTGNYRFSTV